MPLAALPAEASDEPFDIDLWHENHPVQQPARAGDNRLQLGIYPRLGVMSGLPNGVAASAQLSLSLRKPGRFSLYLGGGYEIGPDLEGGNITIGWGGLRPAPATVPQRGFSGAFLRYRRWTSENHGRHRGLSVGVESGLGSLGLSFEAGFARSRRNHWIPVARIGFSLGLSRLWKL